MEPVRWWHWLGLYKAGRRPEQWEAVPEADDDDFRKERKRLSEHHFNRAHTLGAWLLATLVGVNGAAAGAVLSSSSLEHSDRVAALAFVAGIVLAVVAGFFTSQEARDHSTRSYVESVKPANRGAWGQHFLTLSKRRGRVAGIAARLANYASLGSFVAGVWWLACLL